VLSNLILGSALLLFVTGVFTYSMNAVGKTSPNGIDDDPLAQLRAEAEDVRRTDLALLHRTKKMTPQEIELLESGVGTIGVGSGNEMEDGTTTTSGGGGGMVPAGTENKKGNKKPWWRFGF
jgi:hypothetical protein